MHLITRASALKCAHLGSTNPGQSQSFVYISGNPVSIGQDPAHQPVANCPMVFPKPCTTTTPMLSGWSRLLYINSTAVCLHTATGMTDFPAPYLVADAGQSYVETDS